MAKADLQKIAVSLNQAQQVYKALKARRAELSKAVEALQLMGEWQVCRLNDVANSGGRVIRSACIIKAHYTGLSASVQVVVSCASQQGYIWHLELSRPQTRHDP